MLRGDFWIITRGLWRFKKLIAAAALGVVVSTLCFGAGLAMLLPIFQLFFSADNGTGESPLLSHLRRIAADETNWPAQRDAAQWAQQFIPNDPFQSFILALGIVLVLALIGSVGRYLHELLTITAVQREAVILRARLFERMLHAPMGVLEARDGSGHASRILVDITVLSRGQQAILGKAVAEILKGFAAMAVAMILSWQLTLLALVAAPAIAFSMRRFGQAIKRASKRALREQSIMLKALHAAYAALPIIKTSNAEGYERRRFSRINRRIYNEQMAMRQARALSSPVIETLAMIGVMLTATIAAWWFFREGMGADRFLVVLMVLGVAGASLKPLTQLHVQIKEADAAAARILADLASPMEPVQYRARRGLPHLRRHVRDVTYDDVTFTYPAADRPALDGVTFTVPFGTTTAIVGSNGSGKTTLMGLLSRLREPAAGRVLIDGTDVAGVGLTSLRAQISVVTQQTILFEGTIAENIAYARSTTPREKIVEAARLAFAHEFIVKLPRGYDTPLGEGGEGLSGGQRQRLAIARAVLTNPSILILDEATSQIDAESEAKINQALRAVRKGRTTFVIAHRLSTVIDADQIFVMADGRIVDRGTHRELLDRCAVYQMLTRSQLQPPAA